MDLTKQKILITGGAGFVGKHLQAELKQAGVKDGMVCAPPRKHYDLVDPGQTFELFGAADPDLVIHLAAEVGGIGANQASPGRFFYANMQMGLNVIEACRVFEVKRVVVLGTVCAYPCWAKTPFMETELWKGYPEPTNAPYGIAKRSLLVMLQAYRQQYGLDSVYLLPANLYGPGDSFGLEDSHVIPAMIRKFVQAKAKGRKQVTLWGTGSVSREFLYVTDAARAIRLAAEKGLAGVSHLAGKTAPVNIGTGQEITINSLARMIRRLTGFKGIIVWDRVKPDGQPRRCLYTERALLAFGFKADVALEDGLRRTIKWYRKNLTEDRKGRSPTAAIRGWSLGEGGE